MFSWKLAGASAGLLCALFICSSCGDTYRPIANPIITPGGDPQPANFAEVLYTNPNGPGGVPGPGTVQQIDVSGDSVTQVVIVGRNPVFESFAGSGSTLVYTANEADGTITQQNLCTPSVCTPGVPNVITMPLGSSPVAIGSTQTTAVYVVDSAAPQECPNGAVNVLSSGNVVTDTVCVGKNPVAIKQLPSGGKVYIVNQGDNTVSVIDPFSRVVIATIPAGASPVWASSNLDGSYIFVVNKGSNDLTAIHTADNTTTSIPVGTAPNFSIFDSFRNRLYVTNGGSNDVSVLDLSKATPVVLAQHVGLGAGASNPTGVVPLADGSRYYVANTGSNSVSVLDASSNTMVATATANPISLGTPANTTQPLWIESEPTSTKVYVTTPAPAAGPFPSTNPNGAPGVTVIRTDTNAISNFLQAPQSDPNCQVNPNANPPLTCTYQTPLQILTYVHQ